MSLKVRKDGEWVNILAGTDTGTTKVAQLWDQKPKGTNGGTFDKELWVDRTLNTELDPQNIVVLNSGNVYWELGAGTYNIKWSAPAYNVNMHKTRLAYANNSDFNNATYIQGSSEFDSSNISTNSQTRSFGETQLTFNQTTYFKIQHRSHDTQATWGLGSAADFPDTPEIYTQVSIEDLSTAVKEGSGGGSSTFLGLEDVDPTTYTGQEGKLVKVNSAATGLEFSSSGGGGETYTLPLTGNNGTAFGAGDATWTLTASDGTNQPNMHVKAIAGPGIRIDAIDSSEPEVSFRISADGGGSVDTVGTIVAWSGSVANIPTDEYQLCDGGAASTAALQAITGANVPDLRDKFIVGATNSTEDTTYPGLSPGATGGSANAVIVSHKHTTENYVGRSNYAEPRNYGVGTDGNLNSTGDTTTVGEDGTNKNLPPYYSLCYIIKHTAKAASSATTKIATVKDVKAYNGNGGSIAGTTWTQRDLQTLSDPSNIGITVTENKINVPAGTYSFRWTAPAYYVGAHVTKLEYSTSPTFSSGVTTIMGSSEFVAADDPGTSNCQTFSTGILASVSFTQTTYVRILHFTQLASSHGGASKTDIGLGVPTGNAAAGDSIYTQVFIEDLATAVKEGTDGGGGGGGATYSLPCSGTSGDGGAAGGSGNATLTLTGSNGTTDPVQITAGSGMVIDEVQDGGFRLSTSNTTSATERVSILLEETTSGNTFGDILNTNNWNTRYFTRTIESVSSSPLVSFVTNSNTGNPHDGYSLFSLNAGTYLFKWRVPGRDTGSVKARLAYSTTYSVQNLTGTINYQYGESGNVDTFSEHNEYVNGQTTLTITETTYFKIEYYANAGNYGAANSIANVPEIYSQVRIEDLATAVKEDSGGGGGGGTGLGSRGTNSTATTTISKDASDDISIVTQGKSYGLLKVEIDEPAWVVLYVDSASRTSDSNRSEGTDPAPGAGVIAEVSSTTAGSSTFLMTPGVLGWNNDSTPAETVYAKVTNRRSTSGSNAITVTLTTLKLES